MRQRGPVGFVWRRRNRMHTGNCTYRDVGRDCENCVVRTYSLCSQLGETAMSALSSIALDADYQKGTVIFEQNDRFERMFVVTSGFVRLSRLLSNGKRQITGFIGPGDILGGLKQQSLCHCTAEAISDVRACGFKRGELLRVLHDHPDLCIRLLLAATDEIEAQYEQITLLGRKMAGQRLAAFLLIMQHRWTRERHENAALPLPMARVDIADYLGLTVESVSRAFHDIKARGYIRLPKPSLVELKNLPGLYQLAEMEDIPAPRVSMGL